MALFIVASLFCDNGLYRTRTCILLSLFLWLTATLPIKLTDLARWATHEGLCRPLFGWGIVASVFRLFNNNIDCICLQYHFFNVHNLLTISCMQVLALRICHMPCICHKGLRCRNRNVLRCRRFRCRL